MHCNDLFQWTKYTPHLAHLTATVKLGVCQKPGHIPCDTQNISVLLMNITWASSCVSWMQSVPKYNKEAVQVVLEINNRCYFRITFLLVDVLPLLCANWFCWKRKSYAEATQKNRCDKSHGPTQMGEAITTKQTTNGLRITYWWVSTSKT